MLLPIYSVPGKVNPIMQVRALSPRQTFCMHLATSRHLSVWNLYWENARKFSELCKHFFYKCFESFLSMMTLNIHRNFYGIPILVMLKAM